MLFSDIRGVSTLTELLSTAEVAEVLNSYFVRACEPIVQQGGWIVEYFADGDLRQRMREPLTPEVALTYLRQVAGHWLSSTRVA